MAFRPNSILINRGQTVVPSQSHGTQWIDYITIYKKTGWPKFDSYPSLNIQLLPIIFLPVCRTLEKNWARCLLSSSFQNINSSCLALILLYHVKQLHTKTKQEQSPLVLFLLFMLFLLNWSIFRLYLLFPLTSSIFVREKNHRHLKNNGC